MSAHRSAATIHSVAALQS